MYPDANPNDPVFPLDYNIIAEHQKITMSFISIKQGIQKTTKTTVFDSISLLCHMPQHSTSWKIYILFNLLIQIIHGYHTILGHVGNQLLYRPILVNFYSLKINETIESFVKSGDACQHLYLPVV
jgi:Integrase zinc binding domain